MSYNLRLTEAVQFILEPIQRQQNIILSFAAWLSEMQLTANTFSQNIIPTTTYIANINSSKGAFEYYLNNEFNSATASTYSNIFIGTLAQSSTDLYAYNDVDEVEYIPLYFIQDNPPQFLSGNGIGLYNSTTFYPQNEITFVIISASPVIRTYVQVSGATGASIGLSPFIGGLLSNLNVWQPAIYGFNNLQASTTSEDVDFIVWVPKYLNPSWQNPINSVFDTQIKAYINKYKMAHTTFVVNYY